MLKPGTGLLWLICLALCLTKLSYASNLAPIQVNAIISDTNIILKPDTIPSNTPFIIHVIKQTNKAVELENADTSAEIYVGTDKTFKVGLNQGSYTFFNDFSTTTKKAVLNIKDNYTMPDISHQEISATMAPAPADRPTSPVFSEIIFIVWRESIEALLVVSIAFSWIKQLPQNKARAMVYLSCGVVLGLAIAAIFGSILISVNKLISLVAQNYLQAIMAITAAAMIVYMVKWMRLHGRTLKSEMHNAMAKANDNKWNIAILTVVAVAIAREGSEAMIFIYAMGFGAHGVVSATMLLALASGVILAILTMYLLSLGNKIFSWKYFFKITEVLLLLLGGGMLLNGLNLLSTTGIFPQTLLRHLWQSTNSTFGDTITPLLSSLFGYKSSPTILDLIVYIAYWLVIIKLLNIRLLKHHE